MTHEKYDDVLIPFQAMMRAELHANAGKGDRPGWLALSRDTCMLEVYHHAAKLAKALHDDNVPMICEHAADVANTAMMAVDVCGALIPIPLTNWNTEFPVPVKVPSGWSVEIEGDTAKVASPITGPGITVVAEQSRRLEDRILFALAKALAATPASPATEGEAVRDEHAENILNSWLDNQHPDDVAVDAFASKMRQKMAAARTKGRGGWDDKSQCSAELLSTMLHDHIEKGDPVDVANFCMMLSQRGEAILANAAPAIRTIADLAAVFDEGARFGATSIEAEAQKAVADTFERYAALREGHCNGVIDEYFAARRDWTLMPHGIFKDAFYRGFDARDKLAFPTSSASTEATRLAENLVINYRDAIQKLPANADVDSPEFIEAQAAEEAILAVMNTAISRTPRVNAEVLRPIFESTRADSFGFQRSRRGTYQNPALAAAWRAFLDGANAQTGRW